MNPEDQNQTPATAVTATNAEVDAHSGGAVEGAVKASAILNKLQENQEGIANNLEVITALLKNQQELANSANVANSQILNAKRAQGQLAYQEAGRDIAERIRNGADSSILTEADPVTREYATLNLIALSGREAEINPLTSILNHAVNPLSGTEVDAQAQSYQNAHDMVILAVAKAKVATTQIVTNRAGEERTVAAVDIKTYRTFLNQLVRQGNQDAIRLNTYLDGQGNRGSQHIPIEMSRSFIDRAYERYPELNMFNRMDLPSPQFTMPRVDNYGIIFRPDQPGTGVNYVTGNLFQEFDVTTGVTSFNVRRLGGWFPITWDYEEDQDTGLDRSVMLRAMQFRLGEALAAISINGSVLATDLDNQAADGSRLWNNTIAVPAPQRQTQTRDPRFGIDGLRKETIAAATASGGFGTAESNTILTTLLNMRNRLDPRLLNVNGGLSDAVYLAHQSLLIRLLSSNMVSTLEKAGSQATFRTGQFLQVYGVDIVATDNMYPFLTAAGVADFSVAANLRNRSAALLVYRPAYTHAFRGQVRLDITNEPSVQASAIWMYLRHDWRKITDPAMVTATQIIDVPTVL